MADEDLIRRRLLIDGDGTGDARMMAKFTRSLVKWCYSQDNPQESEAQYERLLTTLASVEQSAIKWDNVLLMNSVQIEHYDQIKSVTSEAVTDAQAALDGAKQELSQAREVRNHSLQYHALAKLIQEHPARSPTADKLDKLGASLNTLKTTKEQLEEQMVMRKKQLHVLFTALQQLQSSLDTDQAKETQESDSGAAPLVDLTDDGTAAVAAAPPAPTVVQRLNGRGLVDLTATDSIYTDMECGY